MGLQRKGSNVLGGRPVQCGVLFQVQVGLSVETLVESASELVIEDTSRRIWAAVATIALESRSHQVAFDYS